MGRVTETRWTLSTGETTTVTVDPGSRLTIHFPAETFVRCEIDEDGDGRSLPTEQPASEGEAEAGFRTATGRLTARCDWTGSDGPVLFGPHGNWFEPILGACRLLWIAAVTGVLLLIRRQVLRRRSSG